MASIIDIEGIGEAYAKKLIAVGITSTGKLLALGATPNSRKKLADRTSIPEKLLLEWINHADLFRIKGIGSEYSDLLEAAGVDTVVELSNRKPENLYAMICETNTSKKLVRKLPSLKQVAEWIKQAGGLDRIIRY